MAAEILLKERGKLSIILPLKEGLSFIKLAEGKVFFPEYITGLHSRKNKPIERLLMTFSRNKLPVKKDQLIHFNERNEWSEAYKKIKQGFYIILWFVLVTVIQHFSLQVVH